MDWSRINFIKWLAGSEPKVTPVLTGCYKCAKCGKKVKVYDYEDWHQC